MLLRFLGIAHRVEVEGCPWSSGTRRDVRGSHDYCGLPTDKQPARAMQHLAALLVGLLVAANRMFVLGWLSWQTASASATSLLCRLAYGSQGGRHQAYSMPGSPDFA